MDSPMDINPRYHDSLAHSQESNLDGSFDAIKFNNDIIDALQKHRASDPTAFLSRNRLIMNDHPILLHILTKTFLKDCQMDRQACTDYLYQHIPLIEALDEAYRCQKFADILSHPEMPPAFGEHTQVIDSGMTPSSGHNSIQSVFKMPYLGDTAKLFIETLDHERQQYAATSAASRPYNWSISVIQSSGMGKSRMVEEAANTVFTLPINIRQDMPEGKRAFPPPDPSFRQFFEQCRVKEDEEQQVAYMLFLLVLFRRTRSLVQIEFPNLTGSELAQGWAEYLRRGQTDREAGANRRELYEGVAEEVNRMVADNTRTRNEVERSMQKECKKLLDLIHPDRRSNKNICFVYFDEAHSLTEGADQSNSKPKRSAFHNIGTAISKLDGFRMFFIFLSTTSRLEGFAPPVSHYPSERVTHGSQLIPPFTELPFDIYEPMVLKNIIPLTLEKMCTTDAIVGFGRPLWYTQRLIHKGENFFKFVHDQFTADGASECEDDSLLAALGIRVGITFDATNASSTQSRLVESHLRVTYSIPRHRVFMHTGAPSEPVVAEVAGRYLNREGHEGLALEGPKRLSALVTKGLLAREERGELAGRLLVASAYDLALANFYRNGKSMDGQPLYHRPIPVMEFLYALFGSKYHDLVRDAECLTRRPKAKCLGEAFSNSYVFFSHFALAEDSNMLSVPALATALVRGMALQAKDGQKSIDAVIPIHMGPLSSPISPNTTSAINLQFKNRKSTSEFHVDRSTTVPNIRTPVISIVFEFAAMGRAPDTVKVSQRKPQVTRASSGGAHNDDLHYEIIARGCSPGVYRVVSEDTKPHYEAILGAGTMLEDFPRYNRPDNKAALLEMKPSFNGMRQMERYSNQFGQ